MTPLLKRLAAFTAAAGAALAAPSAFAQASDVRAIPTYESVGLYWSNPAGATALTGCEVKYRKASDTAWSQGLAMWLDARNGECRGSLVQLAPGTDYQVQLNLPGQAVARTLSFKTWANQKPVAKTITVASGGGTLNITEGGSPTGYVVYQGANGAVLDANNAAQFNVTVNASYVILRGLVLKGAQQDAVRITPTVSDVIIEDNEITGWGRLRTGTWGMDLDSAVRAICQAPTLQRVTIQRNLIHDPRYGANSWSDGHPAGPQAVTLSYCGGNHVIRHNEIFSAAGHYFNDILGGEDNHSTTGFPNADSDIYGNDLNNCWDDAIEAEGGDNNVRIWGNYMDQTGTGIASTVASVGPLYVFRNVWNRGRMLEKSPLDQDDRQAMFKVGSDATLGDGRRYLFHNTMLQATQAGAVYTLGGSQGASGTGASQLMNNTVSRNNIYHTWRSWTAFYDVGAGNDLANDLYNGGPGAAIANGINAVPTYATGNGWQSESGGQYALAAGMPGYDQGVRISNFNDSYVGAAPDVGAAEAGAGPMKFGIAASAGPAAPSGPPAPSAAAISSPAPGSTLTGASQALTWNNSGATSYQVWVGNSAGTYDIGYAPNPATSATSATIGALPTDGRTLYVRLWSNLSGTWQARDYTYKASGTAAVATVAAILSPAPGSTLGAATQTFTWNNSGATSYQVWVGNSAGTYDIGYAPNPSTSATSATIGGIPTDGRTLYVRLWSNLSGSWQARDYTYKASGAAVVAIAAAISSPAPGSKLAGATQAFTWNNTGATSYQVWVGSSSGSYDVGYAPNPATSATSASISGIPTDGRTLYVRLWSNLSGVWQARDYTYTTSGAATAPTATAAAILSPAPGTTVPGSTQAFTWNNSGASSYQVWVGNSYGSYDVGYYPTVPISGTSTVVTGLPTDGRTLFVRMYSNIGGVWFGRDYTYRAGP